MKYQKCPVCQLNYVTLDEEICKVCKNNLAHKYTDEEIETEICPICYKYAIGKDDLMCKRCYEKRNKKPVEDNSAYSDQ